MGRAHRVRSRFLIISLAAIPLVAAAGCSSISGSGHVISKSVPVASFTKLLVGAAFEVNVSIGDQEALTLHVDDNLADHVDAGVSNGALHIRLKPGTSVRNATLKADVTALSLSSIELSGASRVRVSGDLTGRGIQLTASGASELDCSMRVDQANVSLSGASNAHLSGAASHLVVEGSGASRLDALELQSTDLEVSLSGASDATVSVSGTISAEVSGASTLRYQGSPRFTKRAVSGASDIEPV